MCYDPLRFIPWFVDLVFPIFVQSMLLATRRQSHQVPDRRPRCVRAVCVCVCVCVCGVWCVFVCVWWGVALALRSIEVLPHGLSIWLFLSSFSLCCWPRAGITESFGRHAPRNVPAYFSLPRTTTARWSLGERGAHPLAWLVRVPVVTFLTPPPAQARGQRWSEK